MSICEQAATESAWIRHMDQALEQSREREPAQSPAVTARPVLLALEGGGMSSRHMVFARRGNGSEGERR
jgi:hypothetical protein